MENQGIAKECCRGTLWSKSWRWDFLCKHEMILFPEDVQMGLNKLLASLPQVWIQSASMFLKIMSSINLIGNIFGLILSFCSEVRVFQYLQSATSWAYWLEAYFGVNAHTQMIMFFIVLSSSQVWPWAVYRRTGIEPSESPCFVLKGRDVSLLFVACLFIWFHLGS